jgi:predicted RNA binding protein with dsRBD fold (UPF0201 family)
LFRVAQDFQFFNLKPQFLAFLLESFVAIPSIEEERQRALSSEVRNKRKLRNMLVNRLHSLFVREAITDMKRKDLKNRTNREENIALLHDYTVTKLAASAGRWM